MKRKNILMKKKDFKKPYTKKESVDDEGFEKKESHRRTENKKRSKKGWKSWN